MTNLMLKSLLKKNTLINYILICFFLFILLILIFSFKLSIENNITFYQENLESRTVEISLKDGYLIDELNSSQFVENINYDTSLNKYEVVLKKTEYIDIFLEKYNEKINFYSIHINEQTSLFEKLNKFVLFICLLIIFSIIFLTFINISELLSSERKNLALYKLLGYTNVYLVFKILLYFTFSHFILYFISNFISYSLISLINNFLTKICANFILIYVPLKINIFILIGMYSLIVINGFILYFKLKKISPIILFKDSEY